VYPGAQNHSLFMCSGSSKVYPGAVDKLIRLPHYSSIQLILSVNIGNVSFSYGLVFRSCVHMKKRENLSLSYSIT
jgi:hypothetical protein